MSQVAPIDSTLLSGSATDAWECTKVEKILRDDLQLAREEFERLKPRPSEDNERIQASLAVIEALDRLSAFVLQGLIPEDTMYRGR